MTTDSPKIYTCPMHPEIISNVPGKCPKCGMNLVLKEDIKKAVVTNDKGLGKLNWKSYLPLISVVGVILLSTLTLSWSDLAAEKFLLEKTVSYFMIGFFLTFALFKLIDLPGFVEGYKTYDLLAAKANWYGYAYPFIELFFGLAMILNPFSEQLLWAEFLVMAFSGLGVAIKIAKKEPFMCACLGTFLRVPLTKITLVEDFGMAGLSLLMILLT